jgi:hypothetical protein
MRLSAGDSRRSLEIACGGGWRLTRDSRRIVDLVVVGVQLGAGKQTDETDEVPYAVRIQLEQATRGNRALWSGWASTGWR